jgi:thiamine biosynthesis lipoprotein
MSAAQDRSPDPTPSPQQQAFLESYSRDGAFERFAAPGMGTENVLLLPQAAGPALGKLAQDSFREFERLERILSKFRADSDLTELNETGAEGPVRVDEDLFRTLEFAKSAWELTDGLFDPTVGELMAAWGLVDMAGRVPDEAELTALRKRRGMDKVLLDSETQSVRLAAPGVRLDLGGIGKGYAADRLVDSLKKAGVEAGAVLCGRSTTVTWGLAPGESRWRFEVVHPDEPSTALTTLEAVPGAMSSSGAYERQVQVGTQSYGHILDPVSGRPCARLRSATVWTGNGLLGDVLSTVLYLAPDWLADEDRVRALAHAAGQETRYSALLIEAAPNAWGGLATREIHVGEAAWIVAGTSE